MARFSALETSIFSRMSATHDAESGGLPAWPTVPSATFPLIRQDPSYALPTFATPAPVDTRVFWRVFVAVPAMGFFSVLCSWAITAQGILLLSDGFQMARVHALRVPAQVIEHQTR
jgi:hypothetical protein